MKGIAVDGKAVKSIKSIGFIKSARYSLVLWLPSPIPDMQPYQRLMPHRFVHYVGSWNHWE